MLRSSLRALLFAGLCLAAIGWLVAQEPNARSRRQRRRRRAHLSSRSPIRSALLQRRAPLEAGPDGLFPSTPVYQNAAPSANVAADGTFPPAAAAPYSATPVQPPFVSFASAQQPVAAVPAVDTNDAAMSTREMLQKVLQASAHLDFGGRQTVTVEELLDQLHQRHQLSIRFDWPTLAGAVATESLSAPAKPAAKSVGAVAVGEWQPGCADCVTTSKPAAQSPSNVAALAGSARRAHRHAANAGRLGGAHRWTGSRRRVAGCRPSHPPGSAVVQANAVSPIAASAAVKPGVNPNAKPNTLPQRRSRNAASCVLQQATETRS